MGTSPSNYIEVPPRVSTLKVRSDDQVLRIQFFGSKNWKQASDFKVPFCGENVVRSFVVCSHHRFSELTRGPIGHILDTTIRCVRAIRVQLPNKGKFAKLKPSLEKYLHYLMEHFLIIIMRVQYKGFYSS